MRQKGCHKSEASLGCLTNVMHILTKSVTTAHILNPPSAFYCDIGTQQLAKTSLELTLCSSLVLNLNTLPQFQFQACNTSFHLKAKLS